MATKRGGDTDGHGGGSSRAGGGSSIVSASRGGRRSSRSAGNAGTASGPVQIDKNKV